MYPFQSNNPFFPLNVDLSASQSVPFTSQYLPKNEISTRMPQIYAPESHSPYTNLPSLLNKRPSPVELNSAPVKMIHQDPFPFPADIYGVRELPKSLVTTPKPEELNAQKLLYRSQPEIFGVPKALSLNGQQFAGLGNGLGFSSMDLTPAEAQQYLGENASQAYIRQYLESKGMNAREYSAQMQPSNEGIQRYLASLYGLQNGMPANLGNLGLQNLTGLEGLGNLGNLAGLGGFGNLGNLGNLGNISQLDLINQMRNQQVLQQLNQQLSMQLLPSLQEAMKNESSLRNSNWADLMLLNQANAQQQNNLLSSLQTLNMGPSPIQQSISPPSNKGNAQTLIIQKPEPVRQHQQEVGLPRKDSMNASGKLAPVLQASHEPHEVRTMPFGNSEMKYRKEAQDKITKNRPEIDLQGRVTRQEKEPERAPMRPTEMRPKKMETSQQQQVQNVPVIQQHQQQLQQQIQQPVVQNGMKAMEMSGDRRKNKIYAQQEQPEKVVTTDKLSKKTITPVTEKTQRRGQSFEEAMEPTRQVVYPQTQQTLKNRKAEPIVTEESERPGNKTEKMNIEERKLSVMTDPQNDFLMKIHHQKTVEDKEDHEHHEHERIDPIPAVVGLNRDHSLTGELNTHQNATAGENFYQTPERVEEAHVPQKIVETRVGHGFQTQLPELALNDEYEEEILGNRRCKLIWDPEYANSKEVVGYLKNLHRILGTKVINQEKALQLLAKKNFNVDEVINLIKKNERHYSNFFGISNCTRELRSRRNIE